MGRWQIIAGVRGELIKDNVDDDAPARSLTAAIASRARRPSLVAQRVPLVPRPPAQAPGPPRPEDGSAAPDGYSPPPAWLGQTRAPRPATDCRLRRRAGRRRDSSAPSVSVFFPTAGSSSASGRAESRSLRKTVTCRSRSEGCRPTCGRAARVSSRCGPIAAFATNRTIYLTYTVLPDGADQAALPRSPGVLLVARARLSTDDRRLEDLKVLLDAEGTGGRLIQAPDGTLLHHVHDSERSSASTSADWPQPQQLDSNMGKVLRINSDGSIPKDNPFVGRAGAHPEIYALGFRDIQGVAIHPRTGALWTSEHGPRGGDEINVVGRGRELRLPGDRLRTRVYRQADQRRQDDAGRDGAAGVLLDAGHRAGGHRVLHRQAVSRLAGESLRVGARRARARSARAQRRPRDRGRAAADADQRAGSAASARARTARSTC